ncbi:DEAD/DEAH box helicase family protein [Patescibacteria group bacterium]|nr:DEAD/DEAH box helicase family protein [Patescibacteria group bacterium]
MKLQFDPSQQYQLDAIKSITDIFKGQPNGSDFSLELSQVLGQLPIINSFLVGNKLLLEPAIIKKNLIDIQQNNNIEISDEDNLWNKELIWQKEELWDDNTVSLISGMNFSVEMETGTGKTYVYLRTIHELYKQYGFKKFVIVVPSIAIKEGVIKNLQITKDHFSMLYENPEMDFYVYDPKKRGQLKNFATTNALQILVINIDSFAKFSASKKGKNIIYKNSDWGVPMEYIQGVKPIVIVDEPQNMETDIRKKAIKNLNPICTLRYSATHKHHYNLVYKLDPVDAYDLGLVKKIEVDSIVSEENYNQAFVELKSVHAQKRRVNAKVKIDVGNKNGVSKKIITVKVGDDLYKLSGERE